MQITPATAMAMKQLALQNEVAVSVLKKTLDITAEQGAELVKLLDQGSGIGRQIDMSA